MGLVKYPIIATILCLAWWFVERAQDFQGESSAAALLVPVVIIALGILLGTREVFVRRTDVAPGFKTAFLIGFRITTWTGVFLFIMAMIFYGLVITGGNSTFYDLLRDGTFFFILAVVVGTIVSLLSAVWWSLRKTRNPGSHP